MKYQVKYNTCDCHPETCCCNRFKVVDKKEEIIATFWHEEDAQKLVKLLEKKR